MPEAHSRKKIAFVLSSTALGGMEMRSVRMARLFAERGYDMYFGCPQGSKLAAQLEGPGVSRFTCRIRGSLDLRSGAALARFLRKEGIQAVMAFSGSDYWMALMAARFASIPTVLSRSTATPLNYFTVRVAARADRLVAVSQSIKASLAEQGIPPAKIELIYNGVDTGRFSATGLPPRETIRGSLGLPEDKFIVACLGRAEKGQHILLRLHRELTHRCPDLHYFFAGQDIPRKLGPLLAAYPEAGPMTTLREPIPFADMPATLHAVDAIVMLPETEPFSNAVIEAMSMGKAMILSRCFGNIEAVEDGVSGLLVDVGDDAAIADAVALLYGRPERRLIMGGEAERRVCRLFSQETMLANYDALWRRLTSRDAAEPAHPSGPPVTGSP